MAGDKRPPVQHVLLSGRALPIVQAIHRVVQTSWSLKKQNSHELSSRTFV